MNKAEIIINKRFRKSDIDRRLFGSFVEHMGRVVYSGIYEKGHPSADEDGFRTDVMEKTREMGVSTIRYPGGNFVSNYHWMDGIGPREQRPRRRDLAWKSIETNEVGIDEFMKWAQKTGVDPILAVNMGTQGLNEAVAFLEYCNSEPGTYYSDLRVKNGREKPYGVKTWCVGNEMDGDWQIGHKTAEEYGRLACETGRAMKLLDPSIEIAVCGSSKSGNPTFPEWDKTVVRHTYDCADLISLHQYYGGQEMGTADFLAQSLDMERFIRTVIHICDVEKAKRRSRKTINIALDEWGVWSIADTKIQKYVEDHPWQIAPAFSEQIYSMEDSLLFASMMLVMLKCADRVKVGCQSLLANVSACIMTEKGGGVWLQPIYYVFSFIANHARGYVMEERANDDTYAAEAFDEVPYVDRVIVYDEERKELILFMVNRGETEAEVSVCADGFSLGDIVEEAALVSEDRKATNKEDHHRIEPKKVSNTKIKGGSVTAILEPLSFELVRIRAE